jgi:hypothetical protein
MIGEFCPKVFALNIHPVFRLKTVVAECGAEGSARTVNNPVMSPFSTARAGRKPLCRIVRFVPYFLSLV